MKKAKKMLNRVWQSIKREEMRILPGQLAFFMVLSIFAIFPLIGLISSSFISNELVESIEKTLPIGVYTVLEALLSVESSGSIIIFGLFAIYLASNGCGSMIITSNVIYKIKSKNIIRQKVKAIFMTVVLILLILFIVVVPAFGELIINSIAKNYPGKIIDTIGIVYHYL